MKKINTEIVRVAEEYWKNYLTNSFLTFLSSKLGGINKTNPIYFGKIDDNKFLSRFLTKNGKYFNPTTSRIPKNQKEYHKTIAQYRYKLEKDYSFAFISKYWGSYQFSNNYIEVTKDCSIKHNQDISLAKISIWLYRNDYFQDDDEVSVIKKKFIADFKISQDELDILFYDNFSKYYNIFSFSGENLINITINKYKEQHNKIRNVLGGESDRHRDLKSYLAIHPELIGFSKDTIPHVEYDFPSGDRVDILFESKSKKEWAVVEIKLEGTEQTFKGLFQVIKYRALQEAVLKFREIDGKVKGYLIAYSIPDYVKQKAKLFDIQSLEILPE